MDIDIRGGEPGHPGRGIPKMDGTHSSITTFEWCLWQSAIWLMATEVPNARAAYTFEVLALSVGANVLLYAIIGGLMCPLGTLPFVGNR
jgi:hypothetical protein